MSDQQDRILRLFIEEAKEHLDTLENGLVDLKSTMKDPESVQEMFRAAHSVKGGAAMLSLDSIKTTAHRLEDCFKVLKDGPVKQVDQTAESLFLKGVDTLKDLVTRLEGPFGLRNEEGEKLVQQAMPVFAQLETHLNNLAKGKVAAASAAGAAKTGSAPPADFALRVMVLLKEMLQVFKQKDSPASRQQLGLVCDKLGKLGTGIGTWQNLVKTAAFAAQDPKNSYKVLAPVIIKEVKEAGDLVQGGKLKAIAPSKNLQLLAAGSTAAASNAAAPAKATASAKATAIPTEPKAVVKLLLKNFNKKQLSEIAKLLIQAIKSSP